MSRIARLSALAVLLGPAAAAGAGLVECVAVEVNGEIVTLSDLQRQKKALLDDIYRQKLSDDETRRRIEEARTNLVDDIVGERLLLQRAREGGISVTKDELDRIVKSIMEQNGLADEKALERALESEGLTLAQLRSNIERRTTVEKVKQYEVASKIVVTDDEAKRWYEEHREDFRDPERVRLREIVLLVEKRDPEQVRREASEIAALIANGADFPELATLFSQAPTAEHGGDLGLLRSNDLAADIREAALALEVGEVSRPIQTRFGFHLLKLVEKKPLSYKPFAEVRGEVAARIQESRYGDRFKSWLEGIKKSAFVKRHDDCIGKAL